MGLYKAKVWPVLELGVFKWTNLIIGAIVGASFAGFVNEYLGIFAGLAVAGTARVLWFYFKKS